MPPADRSSRGLFATRLRQASGTARGCTAPANLVTGLWSGEGAIDRTRTSQNTSAGSARRNTPIDSSAEITAIAKAAANTAASRISVIATGSRVFCRITE